MMLSPHRPDARGLAAAQSGYKPVDVCGGGVHVAFAREDWLTIFPGHGEDGAPLSLTRATRVEPRL